MVGWMYAFFLFQIMNDTRQQRFGPIIARLVLDFLRDEFRYEYRHVLLAMECCFAHASTTSKVRRIAADLSFLGQTRGRWLELDALEMTSYITRAPCLVNFCVGTVGWTIVFIRRCSCQSICDTFCNIGDVFTSPSQHFMYSPPFFTAHLTLDTFDEECIYVVDPEELYTNTMIMRLNDLQYRGDLVFRGEWMGSLVIHNCLEKLVPLVCDIASATYLFPTHDVRVSEVDRLDLFRGYE